MKLLLPDLLVTHFYILDYKTQDQDLHLYFEDNKDRPKEEDHRVLTAHGFHKEITIQDFPLRGKNVYLHIKRRRWLDKSSKQIVQRN